MIEFCMDLNQFYNTACDYHCRGKFSRTTQSEPGIVAAKRPQQKPSHSTGNYIYKLSIYLLFCEHYYC